MHDGRLALLATARAEFRQLTRAPLMIVLTLLEAVTFIVLVSLFGLTGSRAPTAIVDNDHGPLAASLIEHLGKAHNSFALRPMSAAEADKEVRHGQLVAVLTIPAGFSQALAAGHTEVLSVAIDNVDTDLTDDIERAVPSAITTFGRDNSFPGVTVVANERDVLPHDTGYIPYLVVSALAIDAFVVAGVLSAVTMTREWEDGTIVQWSLAPVATAYMVAGKLLAATTVATVAIVAVDAGVLLAYGITPLHPVATVGALLLCATVFSAMGACVGALLRRTLPIAPLFFGLALPVFISSGALEPQRFDGNRLWALAHLSPVYDAIGVLENTVHGLRVTPESIAEDTGILVLFAAAAFLSAIAAAARGANTR